MSLKIDMGGFKNEEVDVVFGNDTYKIMLDPPIEATRMLIELQGLKMDTDENIDKLKEFIATIISKSNPNVDKDAFKNSLSVDSCYKFLEGYNALNSGGQKKGGRSQSEPESSQEIQEQ